MKKRDPFYSPCPCGGAKPAPCPRPESTSCPPPDFPPPRQNGFLMQRILACGKLHRPRQCYSLCLDHLPAPARPPFTVVDAAVSAAPCWTEMPCCQRGALRLEVTVPLTLRVRDGCGRFYTASATLEDELRLRLSCPENECWRGQIFVQAAVRLCGNCCPCDQGCCEAPLEVMLEGYVLAPCAMGVPAPSCRPEPRPWYPQMGFDPFNQ